MGDFEVAGFSYPACSLVGSLSVAASFDGTTYPVPVFFQVAGQNPQATLVFTGGANPAGGGRILGVEGAVAYRVTAAVTSGTMPITLSATRSKTSLSFDANSNLNVNINTVMPGGDQNLNMQVAVRGLNYTRFTATTTGLAVGNPGLRYLDHITISGPVATTVITIYDGTSTGGTVVDTYTVPATPSGVPIEWDFGCYMSTGIFIVVATIASKFTVYWK